MSDKLLFISSARKDYSRNAIAGIINDMGIDISVDDLVSAAHDYLDTGDYLCEGDKYEGAWLNEDFWVHFRILTGRTFSKNDTDSFFACSC